MSRLPPKDSSLCPVCHRPNGCAMAAGLPPQSCWCMNVMVSGEVLATLSANEVGVRCICKQCGVDADAPGTGSAADHPPI
ncbi:MAG: cysteine-rich CWC family protein [Acidovorax sp.]|nr:cysteine-rich CWC family protein [Acidovorax sp.]